MHFLKSALFFFSLIILSSCKNGSPLPKIPEDVKYEIKSEKTRAGATTIEETAKMNEAGVVNICNLEIQLNKKVDKNTLYSIAMKLRESRKQYDNLWIFYRLPNSPLNSGAWATTHFTPNLEVVILGSSDIQDKQTANTADIDGEIIGKWRCEKSLSGATLFLFKNHQGILMMEIKFKDGGNMVDEIKEKKGIMFFKEGRE